MADLNTETDIRKLKIMEHVSLDGVIRRSTDENNFPYADWTVAYRSPAGREMVVERMAARSRVYLLLGKGHL